ncbi:MAG: hypothetical protein ACPG5T_02605, partial [Endozoicomonas sp.]
LETRSRLLSGSDELMVKGLSTEMFRYETLLSVQYRRKDNIVLSMAYGHDFDGHYQSRHYLLKLQYDF